MSPYTINTYTGRHFNLHRPTPDMIELEDIAHGLSLLCRFNGQVKYHYSVAQHCLFMAHAAKFHSPTAEMWCLMHDAAEAYVGDLSSPLKDLMTSFDEAVSCHETIHHNVMDAIVDKWNLPKCPDIVKYLDVEAAAWEFENLFGPGRKAQNNGFTLVAPFHWTYRERDDWFHEEFGMFNGLGHFTARPRQVEEAFIEKFYEIQARMEADLHSLPADDQSSKD